MLIIDEFTNLNVSKGRKAQLRHMRDGFCAYCRSAPVDGKTMCQRHIDLGKKYTSDSDNRHGRAKQYPQIAKMLQRKDRLTCDQIAAICGVGARVVGLVARDLGIKLSNRVYEDVTPMQKKAKSRKKK